MQGDAGNPFARPAMHLAIDMQRLFAEPTEWFVPWLPKVLPNVLRIAECHAERTVFTRFIPPETAEQATGAWRDYYERWASMTRSRLDPRLLELVDPLRKLSPPALILHKGSIRRSQTPASPAACEGGESGR